MVGFGAFKLVRNVSGRVGSLLGLTPLGELPKRLNPPSVAEPTESEREVGDAAGPGLDAGRLDAALERLRAASEPQPEDA